MPDFGATALCVVVMIAAGAMHGLSGTGFALIAMPCLTTILGADQGIRLGFVTCLAVCLFALVGMWRDVELRRGLLLAAGGVIALPLGFLAVRGLPDPVLLLVVGALVLVALGLARLVPAGRRSPVRARGLLLAGAVGGAVHVTSALSAPVFTAYALRTGWTAAAFSATMQVVFICFNVGSVALWGLPPGGLSALAVLLPAVMFGLMIGLVLRRRSSDSAIMTTATAVSVVAALLAIGKGAIELTAG